MVFLIISIIFMTTTALLFRVGMERRANALGFYAAYRSISAAAMLVVAGVSLEWSRLPELWDTAGTLGIIAGLCFWLSGFAGLKAVQLGHLGMSWTVQRCSMVIPTLASLFYWREVPIWPITVPLIARVAGMGTIVVAVILIGVDRVTHAQTRPSHAAGHGSLKAWALWLAAAFFAMGAWETCLRATHRLADDQARLLFVTITFTCAAFISVPAMVTLRAPFGKKEILYGSLAGVCSLIASGLRPWALRDLRGIIVFPVTTASVILLVQLSGMAIWRERVGRWGAMGFAAAIVGVLLVALKM